MGASTVQLLDALQKQVLSVLWLGAPAWFCQLTEYERKDIDRVAKVGLRVIYGVSYSGFENSLAISNIVRPSVKLAKITRQFAKKSSKHPKFAKWFQPVPNTLMNTRRKKNNYVQIPARTDRYHNSPIPYLTRILNEDSS